MNALLDCPAILLPIDLSEFNAKCVNEEIMISWKTLSEERNDYFLLEKSQDGFLYETVSKIESLGSGSSTFEQNYVYLEKSATSEFYYRLVQVDLDGKREVYGPITVECDETKLSYFEVFPNPSQGTNFEILIQEKNKKGLCDLKITDTKGSLVFYKEINIESGLNKFEINENMQAGVYFIEINNNNSFVKRKKIVVCK
jgi:hypothetical protein